MFQEAAVRFNHRILSIMAVLLSLVSAISLPIEVFAADTPDLFIDSEIMFYNPNAAPYTCGSQAATIVGNSNREKAWNFYVQKGLSKEITAGILGNLEVESGFVPDIQEGSQPWPSGGWGIAQWTGSRRTALVAYITGLKLPYTNGATPADKLDELLLAELNYSWDEATSRGDIAKIKTDVGTLTGEAAVTAAATAWHKYYEISADKTPQNRIDHALKIYSSLSMSSSVAAGTSAGGSGCNAASAVSAEGFVYYSQYDPAWSNVTYGTPQTGRTIESSGCGPTSMAMIISTLTKQTVTPKDVVTWGPQFYIPGAGSSHTLFTSAANHWGLKAQPILGEAAVKQVLSIGGLVVSGGKGSYPYTSGGHIIVIRGVTSDGKFLVGNPLPLAADQGKSSSDTLKNTAWFTTAYTWAQISSSAAMYGITK